MGSMSPSSFTVTGSHFTANGNVDVKILNSSGYPVAATVATADGNGNISVSFPGTQVLSIGAYDTPGTYYGSVMAIDEFTGVSSNAVGITLYYS